MVIIGPDAAHHVPQDRRLFAYEDINGEPLEAIHAVITPYLFDGTSLGNPHLVVREEGKSINGLVELLTGSQPIDEGHYILNAEKRLAFLESEPAAVSFLRPFVGAREYLPRCWSSSRTPCSTLAPRMRMRRSQTCTIRT